MDRNCDVRAGRFAVGLVDGVTASALFSEDTTRARAGYTAGGTAAAFWSHCGAGRGHHSLLLCLSDWRIDSVSPVLPQSAFYFAGVRFLLGHHTAYLLDLSAHLESADRPRNVCGAVAGVADAKSSGRRDFLFNCAAGFQECFGLEPDGCAGRARYR